MRQALNNLQATHSGFGYVDQDNVFKVCDQPHPLLVAQIVKACTASDLGEAYEGMRALHGLGYSPSDIITTLFRVVRNYEMPEFLKLEFIREIGFCHMRIGDGVNSPLQLSGLVVKLCKTAQRAR